MAMPNDTSKEQPVAAAFREKRSHSKMLKDSLAVTEPGKACCSLAADHNAENLCLFMREPPEVCRDMRVLIRPVISRSIRLLALRVLPPRVTAALALLSPHLLNWPRISNVASCPSPSAPVSMARGTSLSLSCESKDQTTPCSSEKNETLPKHKLLLLSPSVSAISQLHSCPRIGPELNAALNVQLDSSSALVKQSEQGEIAIDADSDSADGDSASSGKPKNNKKANSSRNEGPMFASTDPVHCTLNLEYDYWGGPELLRAIVPPNTELQTAFSTVGNVIQLILHEHMEKYKTVFGEILLDKNPYIQTVINKVGPVGGAYRTFPFEIVATKAKKDNDSHTSTSLSTVHTENGIKLEIDLAKVYFNPRLHMQHENVVDQIHVNSYVADATCGVGPFAVPAAVNRGCVVFANDLNPDCFELLKRNIKRNRVVKKVVPFCMDGREFIKKSLVLLNQENENQIEDIQQLRTKTSDEKSNGSLIPSPPLKHFTHYIMNLPAVCLSFLDAFHGLYAPYLDSKVERDYLEQNLPLAFVFCFSRNDGNYYEDVRSRVISILGCAELPEKSLSVHYMRRVSPSKVEVMVKLQLPSDFLFGRSKLGVEQIAIEASGRGHGGTDVGKDDDLNNDLVNENNTANCNSLQTK